MLSFIIKLALIIAVIFVLVGTLYYLHAKKLVIAFVTKDDDGNTRLLRKVTGKKDAGLNIQLYIDGKKIKKIKDNPFSYKVYRDGRHEIMVKFKDGRIMTESVEDFEDVKYIEFNDIYHGKANSLEK